MKQIIINEDQLERLKKMLTQCDKLVRISAQIAGRFYFKHSHFTLANGRS